MSNIDTKINELFDIIKKKKVELVEIEKNSKAAWLTNGSIIIKDFSPVTLQTAKEDSILSVVRELMIHRHYTQEAAKLLGLNFEDKYQAFSYEDWFTDCKKRLSIIAHKDKKAQLDELEKRLDKIVSPERRRELELESITASLGA